MSDIKFDIPERYDANEAESGIWIEAYTEGGQHYGDFRVKYNDPSSRESIRYADKLGTKYGKEIRTTRDPVAVAELVHKMNLESMLARTLIDWRGVTAGGKDVPFTVDNAKAYFSQPSTRYCFSTLVNESQKAENFAVVNKDEVTKN